MDELDEVEQTNVARLVTDLSDRGVDAVLLGDDRYPPQLASVPSPPPILFLLGNVDLLHLPSVGMCGSRHATDVGMRAAMTCGEEVAANGLTIVSGYAKGVDSQTHLAALKSGGRTVIVLAEGITHFRRKRIFAETGLPLDRTLIVSQFPPSQRWSAGAAMTRNGVIAGLTRALVVIEAGETGGTFNAGVQALEMRRPVFALEFASAATPRGNQILVDKGAVAVRSARELGELLTRVAPQSLPTAHQMPLL
jgi:DNA processing protein